MFKIGDKVKKESSDNLLIIVGIHPTHNDVYLVKTPEGVEHYLPEFLITKV